MNARINMKTTIQLVKPYNLLLSLNHQVSNKNFETETQCHSLCLQNDGKKLISYILCKYIALNLTYSLKFGLSVSPSKTLCFIYFNENHLQIMKYDSYFMLKALFVLKIFKYFPSLFWPCGKTV